MLTIEHNDNSLEKIIFPTVYVAGCKQALPAGTRVISQSREK